MGCLNAKENIPNRGKGMIVDAVSVDPDLNALDDNNNNKNDGNNQDYDNTNDDNNNEPLKANNASNNHNITTNASDTDDDDNKDDPPIVDDPIADDPIVKKASIKLTQLAQIIDVASTTIQEDEELADDIDLSHADDNAAAVADDDDSDENVQDLFNKLMTMYQITDDMKLNIDDLIAEKVNELSSSSYLFLESSVCSMAGQKDGKDKTNQDSYFVFNEYGPSSILQFFGVCDGHGPSGHNVSQYCIKYLPDLLLNTKENTLITLSKPGYALSKAFKELEKQLYFDKENGNIKFDISASGTTISCGLRVGNYLYLANLGDSRAVIGHFDGSHPGGAMTLSTPQNKKKKIKVSSRSLTVDHDPKNQDEANRINQSKDGKLLIDDDGTSRIKISLIDDKLGRPRQSVLNVKKTYGVDALKQLASVSASVSRSIGDKLAHKYGGVISKPDVIIHKLTKNDLFVMWASDGIWTVLENDDVTRLLGNKLKNVYNNKNYNDFNKITKKLVREARIVWTDEFDDYVDDITAVIARIGTRTTYNT